MNKLIVNSQKHGGGSSLSRVRDTSHVRSISCRIVAHNHNPLSQACNVPATKSKHKHILSAVFCVSLPLMVFSMLFSAISPDVRAESAELNLSASIAPKLQLVIPEETIVLNIDPEAGEAVFDSDSLSMVVATNNPTGYKLTLSADSTLLTRDHTYNNGLAYVTPTIPTITAAATEAAFPTNRWGYRLDSGDYLPFSTNITLAETTTTTPSNGNTTNLTFGAKADLTQPAGQYALALNFIAVSNISIEDTKYIQDLNKTSCEYLASATDTYTVIDKRDGNEYNVRYIDGNCWMTSNLRLAPGTELDSSTSNIAEGTTWTVPTDSTTNFGSSTGYTTPGVHVPTEDNMTAINTYMTDNSYPTLTAEQVGAWYNYCAATAGTICYAEDSTDPGATAEAQYDICPSGWRLPTGAERNTVAGTVTEGGTNNASKFAPIKGGGYYSDPLDTRASGYWWSSTAYSAAYQYNLYYHSNYLSTNEYCRCYGRYVRCVAKS